MEPSEVLKTKIEKFPTVETLKECWEKRDAPKRDAERAELLGEVEKYLETLKIGPWKDVANINGKEVKVMRYGVIECPEHYTWLVEILRKKGFNASKSKIGTDGIMCVIIDALRE